jgi:DedD protein
MEQPMKERLTGAAVLVILGVILIPLLLDGPDPDAPSGRVAEPGRQIIEIKRGADQPAGPGTAIQAVTGVESEPEPAPPSAARTATPADRTAPAAASGPGATPAQDAEPTARGPGPPTAAAVTGKPAAPAPKAAAQPAPKPTPPTAGPAAVPSAGGGWAIQIGSFGSRENADRLKRELDGEGYPVFLMPVRSGGRTLHRVRVGPYSDRATADEVARRLAAAGPGGTVVRHGG